MAAWPATAGAQQGDSASTRYFNAKVVNLRKTASGKTFVTLVFTATVAEPAAVFLYSAADECRRTATLIDGEGNEYGTQRCMAATPDDQLNKMLALRHDGLSGEPMKLDAGSSSSFVFEFSTPLATKAEPDANINMMVPLKVSYCPLGYAPGGPHDVRDRCTMSATSLSFYGLAVR